MDKKFKIWKFLAALFLPIVVFFVLYAVSSIIFTKMFPSFCRIPLISELEMNYHCFVILGLFVCQLLAAVIISNRSKNLFVIIGFCISTLLLLIPTFGSVKGKITYKSKMMNMKNWKEPYEQDEMVGYFINHRVFIGKTYEEVVKDLGEPKLTKTSGKYFYEVCEARWIFELFFENNVCVRQELYCNGNDDYYKENL